MSSKIIGLSLLAAALLPAIALAQTPSTGLLNVYVQVLNQNGFSYSPSNFTVSISGTNPSPSSFSGSQSGTLVSLTAGAYAATVGNQLNYSASYSVGCSGTLFAGVTQTCVITMSPTNSYSNNPVPAPYTQNYPLSCRADTPVVGLGQTARFTASGGVGGTYNWYASSQNFPNVGPALTTTFTSSGTHSVSVTNGAQTATCPITVTTTFVPQNPGTPFYPTNQVYQNNQTYPSYTYPNGYPQPKLTAVAYPRFPNTGLEPLTSAQIAFALVALMGAAIMSYPYARKAFALAVR